MNCLKTLSIALTAGLLFVSCDPKTGGPEEQPSLPENGTYTGTFTVGLENAFTLENAQVVLTADENETSGQIDMLKVKFAEAMPVTLDIAIPGVTLTVTDKGYNISGDGIVPTYASGTPFPDRTITDLEGTATPDELWLLMMCGEDQLTFTGTREPEE
jgi:hypothetical protein